MFQHVIERLTRSNRDSGLDTMVAYSSQSSFGVECLLCGWCEFEGDGVVANDMTIADLVQVATNHSCEGNDVSC